MADSDTLSGRRLGRRGAGPGKASDRRCTHDVAPVRPDSQPRLKLPRFGSLQKASLSRHPSDFLFQAFRAGPGAKILNVFCGSPQPARGEVRLKKIRPPVTPGRRLSRWPVLRLGVSYSARFLIRDLGCRISFSSGRSQTMRGAVW